MVAAGAEDAPVHRAVADADSHERSAAAWHQPRHLRAARSDSARRRCDAVDAPSGRGAVSRHRAARPDRSEVPSLGRVSMCAIAGLICSKPNCELRDHAAAVRTICDLQTHRGPDDRGVSEHGPVCLGSNRLSILDLSRAGHMPMSDPSGRWWIVYNGETYNFQQLREELLGLGHTFVSGSDTEVVLRAFMQWGDACLDRLIGMFAFAVLDRQTNTVTLARDRFGKKPLY